MRTSRMVLCMPRVLWYNFCVGIVTLLFRTLKGSTFACYRKEDVVSYVVHCNIRGPLVCRKEFWIWRQKTSATLPAVWSRASHNRSLSFPFYKMRWMVPFSSFKLVTTMNIKNKKLYKNVYNYLWSTAWNNIPVTYWNALLPVTEIPEHHREVLKSLWHLNTDDPQTYKSSQSPLVAYPCYGKQHLSKDNSLLKFFIVMVLSTDPSL